MEHTGTLQEVLQPSCFIIAVDDASLQTFRNIMVNGTCPVYLTAWISALECNSIHTPLSCPGASYSSLYASQNVVEVISTSSHEDQGLLRIVKQDALQGEYTGR